MNDTNWSAWAAVISAFFAAVAAGIAAWGVNRTRTDVRLQLASEFAKDMAAWSSGVIEFQAKAIPLFVREISRDQRYTLSAVLYNELNFHITRGGLWIGSAESAPVKAASQILKRLREYNEKLAADDLLDVENDNYLKLVDEFVNTMRPEIGLRRRYAIAQAALG